MTTDPLSGGRFAIQYRLTGFGSFAHALSGRFCADQTIEAPLSLLRADRSRLHSRQGSLRTIFRAAADPMDQDRISKMCGCYRYDCLFVLVSQIRETPDGIVATCRRFMKILSRISAAH